MTLSIGSETRLGNWKNIQDNMATRPISINCSVPASRLMRIVLMTWNRVQEQFGEHETEEDEYPDQRMDQGDEDDH